MKVVGYGLLHILIEEKVGKYRGYDDTCWLA